MKGYRTMSSRALRAVFLLSASAAFAQEFPDPINFATGDACATR